MKKKLYDLYDLYPQYGPVESTSLVKACSLMCRLYVKKKFFLGILVKNISVNVSNKSRGSEMHWVGGGGLSPQKENISHFMFELSV